MPAVNGRRQGIGLGVNSSFTFAAQRVPAWVCSESLAQQAVPAPLRHCRDRFDLGRQKSPAALERGRALLRGNAAVLSLIGCDRLKQAIEADGRRVITLIANQTVSGSALDGWIVLGRRSIRQQPRRSLRCA